jgi:hypothetical protein
VLSFTCASARAETAGAPVATLVGGERGIETPQRMLEAQLEWVCAERAGELFSFMRYAPDCNSQVININHWLFSLHREVDEYQYA